MAWVMDTVSDHVRQTEKAVVTGKPLTMGGTRGSRDAVARGLHVILRLALERYHVQTSPTRVLIQGVGTVGGQLARLLHAEGVYVCGLSDRHCALYDPNGLDVPAILAWRAEGGSLADCPGEFERIANDELLGLPCDVLVPCAVANAIDSRNARNVRAKMIIEGAHGPITARADRILDDRGIPVVPDILANAGGVVANYFEWVQNRQGISWIELVIQKRLKRFMSEAWNSVSQIQLKGGVRLRMAANMLAVERVAKADQTRGIYA
jgi:glutamate dehydrogenase (NAD(P)+)